MPKLESPRPAIVVAAGPREAESQLLRLVEDHLSGDLDRPIRIVVPSRSLRRHVLRVLANHFGAVVGVTVQTHRALALEVLERAGLELPSGGARVLDLLARSFAGGSEVLEREFGGYEDGGVLVAAVVRDLLDACFTRAHLEGVVEAVREAPVGGDVIERAVAVLAVAARCETLLDHELWAHRSTVQSRSTEVLALAGGEALPSRAIVIYGFAETTGLLADFLEKLVQTLGAVAIIDHPPDPAKPAERDAGWPFSSRLVDRLVGPGSAARLEWQAETRHVNEITAFNAPGPEAEVREIADRIQRLPKHGFSWESIGVVFRRLDDSTVEAVRRHFTRLGIPFSGEGATAPGGAIRRRAISLAELLVSGSGVRTGAWIGATVWDSPLEAHEVDLAVRAQGAARLAEVAALTCSVSAVSLPTVDRLLEVDGDAIRHHRKISAATMKRAIERAGAVVELLACRPDSATVGELFAWIRDVVGLLGRSVDREADPIREAIDGLERELPGELEVKWGIFAPLLLSVLDGVGAEAMGGDGGGVQVLSVMEARGRTFDRLYLAGLNRGVFPAAPVDDPVFPSQVRYALATGPLPDMPLKTRDSHEERYLFAQLMAAAPNITLSWRRVDAGGKEMNPSVFLERLRMTKTVTWNREGDDEAQVAAPDLFSPRDEESVRPPLEYAVVGGLDGRNEVFGTALSVLAGARSEHLVAVLDEIDPSMPRRDLGPFLGVVGLSVPATLWVTRLEQVAVCPWQAFLERELGLVPPPEAAFAEEGVSGRVAGQVVHAVLETISTEQGAPSRLDLETIRQRSGVRVAWPSDPEVASLVETATDGAARRDGVPALAPAIAAFSNRLLARAREEAWPDGEVTILGVETLGGLRLRWSGRYGEDRELELRFRADRVEPAGEDESLILVDYKTGSVCEVKAETAVPRGQLMQGAAYALAGAEGDRGRYISFKDPDRLKYGPVVDIDRKVAESMEPGARAILESWDQGVLFPRLSKPDGSGEGAACRWCTVKAACLLGEPGVKRRLVDALEALDEDSPLRLMWNMPAKSTRRTRR